MYGANIGCILNVLCALSAAPGTDGGTAAITNGRNWNAYTDPVTGARVHRLVAGPSEDDVVYYTHPMWTQGMAHLLFNAARGGQDKALHALRLSDGAVARVAPVVSGYAALARKSDRVYYIDGRDVYACAVRDAFGEAPMPERLASFPSEVKSPSGGISLGADEESLYIGVDLEDEALWALMALDVTNGEWRTVTTLRFHIGHVQASPFEAGYVMFCHETGGFATQRTWVIREGDLAPRPMFKAPHDYWVTHESWWGPDRIVFTVWPYDDARKQIPHGLLSAPVESGEATEHARYPAWHTHGSPDGRWIVGDDFDRNLWLVDTTANERRLLTQGHLGEGFDTHPHASFTPDGKGVVFNSSHDGHADVFLVEIPEFESLPTP